MSSSSGLVPEAEASARLGAGVSFFDFDHFNYIVALKRAYSDISFKDLTTGFNHHYYKKTSEAELEMIFEDTQSAAQGKKSFIATSQMVAPFHFWPEQGFDETEMHKLFILASFRHAYEISMKMVKAGGGYVIDDTLDHMKLM